MTYHFTKNLDYSLKEGLIITKTNHSKGEINGFEIIESSHPILDEKSFKAGKKAINFVSRLTNEDQLFMLISGGGSSLIEYPEGEITISEFQYINKELLNRGANIVEINTVRKELSKIKGGKLASLCPETKITNIIISDVLGNKLDSISSGPTVQNTTNSMQAIEILNKYNIPINDSIQKVLLNNKKININNSESFIVSDINRLCDSAFKHSKQLGYTPHILARDLNCNAVDAGRFIGSIAKEMSRKPGKNAYIFCGETIVNVRGNGKGGRNQEIALSSARNIKNINKIAIFSIGTDGTDGPTEAAGGIVNGTSLLKLEKKILI